MTLVVDPAGTELKLLARAADWRGKRLLEIGCGDGRLSLRLASLEPRRIDALDPDPAKVRLARQALPPEMSGLVHFAVGRAERLKFPDGIFDSVIFSWSL